MGRIAAKIDGNHSEIVDALRAAGASVQSLAEVGHGCPDLLCGIQRQNFILEIKDPSQAPSDQRLTPQQKHWHATWNGTAHIVYNVDNALQILDHYRMKGRAK